MKEPKRIPLDPSTPKVKNVKTIPLPPLDSEKYKDTDTTRELSFWQFIAKHKESRNNWMKHKNENNQKGDQT